MSCNCGGSPLPFPQLEDKVLSLQGSLNESECRLQQQQDEVLQRDKQHSEELRQCSQRSDNAEERIRELQVDLGARERELQSVRYQERREERRGEDRGENTSTWFREIDCSCSMLYCDNFPSPSSTSTVCLCVVH